MPRGGNPKSYKNLKPWKPGQAGNILGCNAKLPADIIRMRKKNPIEVERALDEILKLTFSEVKELALNPNTPSLKVMIASMVAKCIQHGDAHRAKFILEMYIGPSRMMVVAGDSGGADESSGTVSHALLLKFVEDASKDQPEGGTSNNGQAKEAD